MRFDRSYARPPNSSQRAAIPRIPSRQFRPMEGSMRTRLFVPALALLAGCGGGGRIALNPAGGGGGTDSGATRGVTATFHVDVPTGRVSVKPEAGGRSAGSSRAVFTGSAVS